MVFDTEQKILFIGDSITDCGRRGEYAPYGNGYVSLVRALLLARYPALELSFENRGIGGNTVRDLAERWERDVLRENPDWLSVMIGINDVWRFFGGNPHEGVPLTQYAATLRQLLDQTQAHTDARLILMEPYMIEPDPAHPMRSQMDLYGVVVRSLAEERGAVLVRTQSAFDEALRQTSPQDWADDQIHPDLPGHTVIALAFLRAVGFEL